MYLILRIKLCVLYLGIHLTKFEAFLQDQDEYEWNITLPICNVITQGFTSIFLILTVIGIKCLFVTKMKRKPKIRNTVGFRILSILYGLGLFLSVFLNTVIPNQGNDFIFHYIISLVFKSIIFSKMRKP